ncbi:MAG: hypothetical protein ACTSQS_15730 [Promethearchaeota archaeon]
MQDGSSYIHVNPWRGSACYRLLLGEKAKINWTCRTLVINNFVNISLIYSIIISIDQSKIEFQMTFI